MKPLGLFFMLTMLLAVMFGFGLLSIFGDWLTLFISMDILCASLLAVLMFDRYEGELA